MPGMSEGTSKVVGACGVILACMKAVAVAAWLWTTVFPHKAPTNPAATTCSFNAEPMFDELESRGQQR